MKKIVGMVLTLCLMLGMMALPAAAQEATIVGKGTEALIDIMGQTDFADVISFTLFDAQGERYTYEGVLDLDRESETYLTQLTTDEAKALVAAQGWSKANAADQDGVKIIEQPEDSELTDADVNLEWVGAVLTIKSAKPITAEGKYTFEVTLDNGESTQVSCAAKAFTTPVELRITGTTCVEQGAPAYLKATWYDESGVPKNATDSEDVVWEVSGAASYGYLKGSARYAIYAVIDEAQAGSNIDVTLTDKANGLSATHTVKVASGEKTLVWDHSDAVVGEENTYVVTLVDADGDAVKLCCCSSSVEYVVVAQPEGANVTVTGNWKGTQGQSGNMQLISDQLGEVTVQMTLNFQMSDFEADAEGNMNKKDAGTMTYTATQTFTVAESK